MGWDSMFPMEKAILKLLQGQVFFNDELIPIIRRNKPIDVSPCITIEQASHNFKDRKLVNTNIQFFKLRYASEIWINIWCNSEEERNSIVNQINTIFLQATANHYLRCGKYDEGLCLTTGNDCQAPIIQNGRTAKDQCPNPEEYSYMSFFKKNNILKNTFYFDGESNMDELDLTPPVLRTLIKVNMDYYDYYSIGGELIEDFKINIL